MKKDDFRNRYLIKLTSSLIIVVFNMVIQLMLPRALSLEEYGYYSYNLNVFTSIVVMANLSTSNALVAKFSKRNDEIGLVYFYLRLYAIMALTLCVASMILYKIEFMQNTFAGQTLLMVMLGLASAIVLKALTDCVSLYDAFAISRFPAIVQIVLKVIIGSTVLILFMFGTLNLMIFYVVQISVIGITVVWLLFSFIIEQKKTYPIIKDLGSREYTKEYTAYCSPLVVATIVSQIVIIAMNWALMKWSGIKEQALFGAAWQLNTLVGYIFSPYAELSKREFAVIHDDIEQLKLRFTQALKMMMWITAYFAIFIGIESEWILPIIYGDKYSGATIVTLLIMFYTIYQAWGQICGSFILAMEYTRLSATISIVGQLISFLFVFVFQIPNRLWPNGLGSVGIALNYLICNIVVVAINIIAISKRLSMNAIKLLGIQVLPISLCTMIALLMRNIMNCIYKTNDSIVSGVVKTIIAGVIYTTCIAGVVYQRPNLIGLSKISLRSFIKRS